MSRELFSSLVGLGLLLSDIGLITSGAEGGLGPHRPASMSKVLSLAPDVVSFGIFAG